MEKIEHGKYVELGYDLYRIDPDGTETLVHQSDPDDPEKIIFGITQGVILPLEKAIEGLEPGGEFDIKVNSDQAFGPHTSENVATLERDLFLIEGKFDEKAIKPGAILPMMTGDGFRLNGLVVDVTSTHVVMDFNHPLAGKDVRFKGKILTVRDATPEELKPRQCGCGNCNCGDGDGCGESCGNGCCQ